MNSSDSIDDGFDQDNSVHDVRVIAAVKQYMSMLEAGNAPTTHEFIKQYEDIAAQLRPSLDGLALIHRAAEPKSVDNATSPDSEFTSKPIGDFQIVGELGRGGMGVVYEAIQLSLGRHVALKVLPFASGLDEVRLQRFRNEAHAAAALHHTNIVPVYAVGSDRGVHYFAMQLIKGQTLADVIQQMRTANGKEDAGITTTELADTLAVRPSSEHREVRRKSSQSTTQQPTLSRVSVSTVLSSSLSGRIGYYRSVVKMAHQAALAIQHAHQYGVIHRDVKPANLMLDVAGQIWVTDFGLAQIQHADSNMTRTGDPMGTLKYMSPEQAVGNRAEMDHRTDIYSLGITLYELLTLEPAIKGGSYREMLNRVAELEPPSPKSIDPALPIELDTIVRKATSKAPSDRYDSAKSFAEDLQSWLDDKPIAAKPPTAWERFAKWRRRNSGLVAMASVVLLAATIGLFTTTLLVYRALDRETQQRELAEVSFQQAKSAVDQFSYLSESELAFRPDLQDLRRSFLETSLAFYKDFVEHRSGDPKGTIELEATSSRVEKMVEELRVLNNIAPMEMLSDSAIQEDLGIDATAADMVAELVDQFQKHREALAIRYVGSLQTDNSAMSDLLRQFELDIAKKLSETQLLRLRQISRQQRLPFVFKSPEVAAQLELTQEQRESVSRIIEETRPNRGDGERSGFRDGPPHPPPDDFSGGWPPKPEFGSRRFRIGGFDMAGSPATQNTTLQILKILTPEQQRKWKSLIGEPFKH